MGSRGGGRCWWSEGNEEGGYAGYRGYNRNVEDHVGDIGGFGSPEGVDELPEGAAEGICERGDCCCAHAATFRKPEVTVSCGSAKYEGLSKAHEDLAEHNDAEVGCSRACVADPIAY